MSISTPQAGGNRRQSSKPAAGAKPAAKSSAGNDDGTAGGSGNSAKSGTSATSETPAKSGGAATATAGPSAKSRTSTGARSGSRGGRNASGGGSTGERPGGRPPTGNRPGGGNRPPMPPLAVNNGPNWGPIILFSVVGLVAVIIVGVALYAVAQNGRGWQSKADSIKGIVDYRKTEKQLLQPAQHAYGKLSYPQSPPVGGTHNYNWERCQGDVYTDQVPNENAVHALEHGAVWITYNPSLSKDQVDKLASKVRGNDFMLMSPYPGLDKPISLQAWGFQLKLDDASDARIDQFIQDLRVNATMEPQATCGTSSQGYVTKTGPDPSNLGQSAAPAPSAN
jgi:type II secretory pathway pseudopilin PulG